MATALDAILRDGTPIIDVRSAGEFAKGSFDQATNLPLLDDDERHQVGLTYREHGQQAAIAKGNELVSGQRKAERIRAWAELARAHPDAVICCWRGGLRSRTVAEWLAASGTDLEVIEGGFKALRRLVLDTLEHPDDKDFVILGGRTGARKTELIGELDWSFDLEAAANHRGSSFGAQREPQPSQVTFENRLAVGYLRAGRRILLEDEARNIGSVTIPEPWVDKMRAAPLVVLEVEVGERAEAIARDYVRVPLDQGVPEAELIDTLAAALLRLRKRLGDQRWRAIDTSLRRAFETGEHQTWIEPVLEHYYDPMYEYQIERFEQRIVFRGNRAAVTTYLEELPTSR
jgi:tRNA 2-selenouridine synthase